MGFALQRARHLAPGDRLGKYDLIRQIAVGGMAELYLARTVGLEGFEKLVVVKRILPQFANNATFVNMFLNEARLAATLHHPNIAQVYDIGQEQGDYFFSMEYVHGEDLGRFLATAAEQGVPVSVDAALTLVSGLCAGLHHAHEKAGPDGRPLGVVHRDVSPSNVLVGYDGTVKLVDFGIARVSQSTPTSQGFRGKVAYMSPEQGQGRVALDRRSDIFSIGTILYELTTGQVPFVDETEYGVLSQIVNRDADPPSTIVPGYPPALEAIVMRALARDPNQRFATALELQTQLEDFAHDSRLRVSPLVIGRLMSTLFPARLEEWDHARAQGAFFVEQHVVRTLIESGKTGEPPTIPQPRVQAPTTEEELTAIAGAPTPDDAVTHTRVPTPIPIGGSAANTIPVEQMSGVPVHVGAAASRGTLVSNARHPVFGTTVPPQHEVTERVRVPDATVLVNAPRSSTPTILLAMLGASAAAAVTYFALVAKDAPSSSVQPAAAPTEAVKPLVTTPPPPPAPAPKPAPVETAPAAVVEDVEPPPPATTTATPSKPDAPPKKRSRKSRAVKPKLDAKPADAKKPPAKKDWTDDSPFMPVRPDKAP
ncbi:MAG TPA: protein kinase [Kofleriaceae bacterium]|nr:protein kinase [Kofleriaceae bacterium]